MAEATAEVTEVATPQPEEVVKRRTTEPRKMQDYLAERSEQRARTPEPEPAPQEDATPEPEESEEEGFEATREEESTEFQADPSTDDGEEGDDFPDTLEGLAETLGFEVNDLTQHLQATVKVDGKESQVSLHEALRSFMRESDYLQKTEALANARKAHAAEREQVTAALEARVNQADQMLAILAETLKAGPSDAELAQLSLKDPTAATQIKMERDAKVRQYQQIAAQRQAFENSRIAQANEKLAEHRTTQQQELLRRNPDLKDPEKMGAFERDAMSYLKDSGFTEQEVTEYFNGPFDAKYVSIIRDGLRYRKANQTNPKKVVKKAPKPARSKARQGQRHDEPVRKAKQRLKQGGRVQDGIALLKARRLARSSANGGSQ